jgi:hypothetical protein
MVMVLWRGRLRGINLSAGLDLELSDLPFFSTTTITALHQKMLEKRPAAAPTSFPDASSLRVAIVHARWNAECIEALVKGACSSLEKAGVKAENIIIESVPGSFELPVATSRCVFNPRKRYYGVLILVTSLITD